MDRGFQRSRRLAHLDPGDLEAQLRLVAAELRGGGLVCSQSALSWRQRLAKLNEPDRFDALIELAKLGPAAAGVTPVFVEVLSAFVSKNEDGGENTEAALPRAMLNEALTAIKQLGEGSISDLVLALSSAPIRLKAFLLQALRTVQAPEYAQDSTVAAVALCLDDEDSKVRYHAAELLRFFGSKAKAALPNLSFRLRDKDRNVRVTSLLAIRKIGPNSNCLPMLTRSLKDSDPLVRYWAARIIGDLGAHAVEAQDALYRLLLDDDHHPRKAALAALDKINKAVACDEEIVTG
ncbi:MAG: HEAT repeat domain-containing protein [Planctomycetota bacterium]|nr:HEAT repeat domain-containing protein [Planctomycetota bacterium]